MAPAVGLTRRAAVLGALGVAVTTAAGAEALPRALSRPALKVARPTQAVLQAICRAGRRLVAAGERGLIVCSDDNGRSWSQASVPVSTTITALHFADARLGWAVGNMGVVLRTEDGGATWTKQLDGVAAAQLALAAAKSQAGASQDDAQRLVDEGADKPLLGITRRVDGSLIAVGAYGLAFSSTDGGRNWQSLMPRLPNPDGLTYYGVAERRGEAVLFGEQGLLLRSAAGADFTAQASPANGSLFGALALREGPMLLLGLRGKFWRSAQPGDAWEAQQTLVEASLIAGTQLQDGRVLLAGSAGQVLLSSDGGQHFSPLPLEQRFPFTGLVQADDGALLMAGMRGLVRIDRLKS